AAWVRSVMRATDWLMLPAVRHAVDASLAGLLVARVLTVPATASAQTTAPIASMVSHSGDVDDGHQYTRVYHAGVRTISETPTRQSEAVSREVIHVVRAGETWSSIAREYFGDEDMAEQLPNDNVGRGQPHGQHITRNGLIHEGWTVRVLDPTRNVEAAEYVQ